MESAPNIPMVENVQKGLYLQVMEQIRKISDNVLVNASALFSIHFLVPADIDL